MVRGDSRRVTNEGLRIAVRLDDRFLPTGTATERAFEVARAVIARAVEGMGPAEIEVSPLIESIKPDHLAAMRDEATRLDPDYQPVDFGVWFQVATPPGAD